MFTLSKCLNSLDERKLIYTTVHNPSYIFLIYSPSRYHLGDVRFMFVSKVVGQVKKENNEGTMITSYERVATNIRAQ